ncbi:MAG: phosphorylase [Sphingomonadales bacterium]|nr:phosphorylase [Sphingomonadales bacterium]
MKPTEWMRTPVGAVYHLNLMPEQLADTIILVGDPDRVEKVSRHFDCIEYRVQHREFVTHTGIMGPQRISVVGTGIGTDNIDIVLNELDSLHNLDFVDEQPLTAPKSLRLIRLGTSGALQADLEVGTILCSSMALGLDGLMPFYADAADPEWVDYTKALLEAVPELRHTAIPVLNAADPGFLDQVAQTDLPRGFTLTCAGFYAPQGRRLRLNARIDDFIEQIADFRFPNGMRITNIEMETAGIYGLARLMGHRAVSVNAILANRATGHRCQNPVEIIDHMIRTVLERL